MKTLATILAALALAACAPAPTSQPTQCEGAGPSTPDTASPADGTSGAGDQHEALLRDC